MGRKKKSEVQVSASKMAEFDFAGAWYMPKKSGWGVLLNKHVENTVSVVIFTFDGKGNQLWFNGVGPWAGTGTTVDLYKPSATNPFSTISEFKLGEKVGNITLREVDGSLNYDVFVSFEASGTSLTPDVNFSPTPSGFTDSGTLIKI